MMWIFKINMSPFKFFVTATFTDIFQLYNWNPDLEGLERGCSAVPFPIVKEFTERINFRSYNPASLGHSEIKTLD